MRTLRAAVLLVAMGCSSSPPEGASPPSRPMPSSPVTPAVAAPASAPVARGLLRFNRRTGLPIQAVVFSPDGKRMASLCGSGCEKDAGAAHSRLLVWSLPDLKIVGGAPYELAPDLGRSFFAGLALETKKP